jgi:hypothetical protein
MSREFKNPIPMAVFDATLVKNSKSFGQALTALNSEGSCSYNVQLDRESYRRVLHRRADENADQAEETTTLMLTPQERDFLATPPSPGCAEFAPKNLEKR